MQGYMFRLKASHLQAYTTVTLTDALPALGSHSAYNEIKKGRLRWLGHVERMSEERVVKRLYQNTPEGSRSVGRPRLRWMDNVREDLRKMGVTNWRIRAHRRDDRKMVVKEAKDLLGL